MFGKEVIEPQPVALFAAVAGQRRNVAAGI
jgi:hypothetical protein